ncbi:acetyl-CoA acetyltransferase [Carnobacterium gallinarum]|uniref:acetyl-CoA acetyltransferase n=1 Tax=Carnobacterium gallinarum TaxID=2749 RepID=UPI001B80E290|nr:acetyl-CoA acetyltransferase [Carnobacterium gallinarum]
MGKIYILGGAQTDFERNWTKEGKSFIALLTEVVEDTLKNANLSYEDIAKLNKQNRIACFIGNFGGESYVNQGHLGALLTEVHSAFYGVPSARYEAACASGSVAIDAAITKLRAEDYDVTLVIGWELMKTVNSTTGGDILGLAAFYEKEAKGISFPFPKLFGSIADEIVNRDKANQERIMDSLALLSNKNYKNAKQNKLAQTRKWYMSLEQAKLRGTDSNPSIGGLLAISDCSQVTDGAVGVVLVNENFKTSNSNKSEIKGWGHRVAPMLLKTKLSLSKESPYILPWTKQTIDDTYQRAKLSVNDIDVFETHDCFTSSEYLAISSFGICAPGNEFEVIEQGIIEIEGSKPINPSGGLIGCGHPVGASGVRMLLDLHKQVTGTAVGYQITNAKNAMMLNIGGSATTNYSFIVGRV